MNPLDRSVKKQFIDYINDKGEDALLYLDAPWEEIARRLLPDLEGFDTFEGERKEFKEQVVNLEVEIRDLESEVKMLRAKLDPE